MLWHSYWGQFGWLSLKLPRVIYLFYIPPLLLVTSGIIYSIRRANPVTTVALLMFASNAALFFAYLAWYDWQPQGRYLFPSLAAQIILADAGLRWLSEKVPWLRRLFTD